VEHKLFETAEAFVSTFGFHEHRERAPHLEQGVHQGRLRLAADFVRDALDMANRQTQVAEIVDLGCGDGGLLSLISHLPFATSMGYDFQPSNSVGWAERNVKGELLNFVEHWADVKLADVYVATEVLEHLTDPHQMVRNVSERGAALVASSPWTEHKDSHDECHAWAWDEEGYKQLMWQAKFKVIRHETTGMFQVILAVPR
jgi:2-polyprenyl-3-methyl-5-hydroxy-6-metoxy-1,4-benzoquinol methylase